MNILKKIKSKATVQNESTVIKPPEIIDLPVEKSQVVMEEKKSLKKNQIEIEKDFRGQRNQKEEQKTDYLRLPKPKAVRTEVIKPEQKQQPKSNISQPTSKPKQQQRPAPPKPLKNKAPPMQIVRQHLTPAQQTDKSNLVVNVIQWQAIADIFLLKVINYDSRAILITIMQQDLEDVPEINYLVLKKVMFYKDNEKMHVVAGEDNIVKVIYREK